MIIAENLVDFNAARKKIKGTIGLVPTMGALHKGHLSLIKKAVQDCDSVIVSDFINPTQFNNLNDFKTYPKSLEQDCALAEKAGVDIVFAPRVIDIYPEGSGLNSKIFDLGGLDKYGEGPRRPGHFNGMAQVVTRLFDIVSPDKAYFGEKDFQQLVIVEYFTKKLGYDVEIVRCPIARADDGLALSSRNKLLDPQHRAAAPHIFESISKAAEMAEQMSVKEAIEKITRLIDAEELLKTEYVEIINSLTLQPVNDWDDAEHVRLCCAVYAGQVRLIDNIKLK